MRLLADKVLRPVASLEFPGAWHQGLRLMALDETLLGFQEAPESGADLGSGRACHGQPAPSKIRLLALAETATRAVAAAEAGPWGSSGLDLAAALIGKGKLAPDMLLAAGETFFCHRLWSKADSAGAKLAWRADSASNLPVLETLPDGSFISLICDKNSKKSKPIRIRVIEYDIDKRKIVIKGKRPGQGQHRLATNIFDFETFPAEELALLGHEKWKIEGLYRELKLDQPSAPEGVLPSAPEDANPGAALGAPPIAPEGVQPSAPEGSGDPNSGLLLRGQTLDSALQDLWGKLLVHFALRGVMAESDCQDGFFGAKKPPRREKPSSGEKSSGRGQPSSRKKPSGISLRP
jgi:hypothetical protein